MTTDLIEALLDSRYIGQEGLRRLAADEIERLRAALNLIAQMEDEGDEWDGRDRFHRVRGMARSAVEQKIPERT